MTYILKTDAVSEALDKAVNLKGGDYRYEKPDGGSFCRYSTDSGAPSCIVGFVLAEVAPDLFADVAEYEAAHVTSLGVEELATEFDIEFESEHLVRALDYAQTHQDEGDTWAEAQQSYYNRLEWAQG